MKEIHNFKVGDAVIVLKANAGPNGQCIGNSAGNCCGTNRSAADDNT